EESLEELETLPDSLGVIETVRAEQDPAMPVSLPEARGSRDHRGIPGDPLELGHVDADRVRGDFRLAAVVPQQPGSVVAVGDELGARDLARALREVVAIERHVKGHGVGGEDAAEQLLAPGQRAIDLRRREWRVQEEIDAPAETEVAEVPRHAQEVE